jgi:hypothetical protein
MDISSVVFGVLLGAFVAAVFTPAPTSDLCEVDVRQLAEAWAGARISPGDPYELKQAELKELVQSLARKYPEVLRAEKAGVSVEGREIFLVSAVILNGRLLNLDRPEPVGRFLGK